MLAVMPGSWVATPTTPGFWGNQRIFDVSDTRTIVTLNLWPTTRIMGRVNVPEGTPPPKRLNVTFEATPNNPVGSKVPHGSILCPVVEGAWSCEIPEGWLDVRIGAKGFVPHYWWDLQLKRSTPLKAQVLALAPGKSIVGFVTTTAGTAPLSATVTLTTLDRKPVFYPRSQRRRPPLPVSASVNHRGFFQLTGVPPGDFRIEASGKNFSVAAASVRVTDAVETRLPDFLILGEPIELDVTVVPPIDPSGRPWRLTLISHESEASDEVHAVVPAHGHVKVPGLTSGEYRLIVEAADPLDSERWFSEIIRLDPAPGPLVIEIPLMWVRGTVTLGSRPLSARLAFGGSSGAVRVYFESDVEGSFAGFLPRADKWIVQVTADHPPVSRILNSIPISPSDNSSEANIKIELADTELSGTVVDEEGVAIRAAIVTVRPFGASTAERLVQTQTDAEGGFEFHGLAPGPVHISAEARVNLDILEVVGVDESLVEGSPKHLRLTARRGLVVTGTILSAPDRMPVAGAFIKATAAGSRRPTWSRSSRTDSEGQFEVFLPPGTREADFAYGGAGYSFKFLRRPIPANRRMEFDLERTGGTLALKFQKPWPYAELNAPAVSLFHSGAQESASFILVRWAMANGSMPEPAREPSKILLPRMAVGEYAACIGTLEELRGSGGHRPVNRCVSGSLGPDGELQLELPLF